MTGAYLDTDMPDGFIRFEGDWDLFMSHETFLEIMDRGPFGAVADLIRPLGPGTYPVPKVTVRRVDHDAREEAVEVARALQPEDRGPSEVCAYPPCLQPALLPWDGWLLCTHHELLLTDASPSPR